MVHATGSYAGGVVATIFCALVIEFCADIVGHCEGIFGRVGGDSVAANAGVLEGVLFVDCGLLVG